MSLLAHLGCIGHRHLSYSGGELSPPVAFATEADADLRLPLDALVVESRPRGDLETAAYSTHELQFDSMASGRGGHVVEAIYQRARAPGRRAVVIVLPIWGSSTYPPRKVSAALRRRSQGSLHVVRILGPKPLLDWEHLGAAKTEGEFRRRAETMQTRFLHTVVDLRRLIDWLAVQPEVDPRRMAVVGFSMGAMVGGMLLTQEPRIAAGVLVMGGAEPHEIVASCPRAIGRSRQAALERFGWSVEEYRRVFEEIFVAGNAARHRTVVHPRRVLIVDGKRDRCMPEPARESLWQTLGQPERITYDYGHRASFLALTPLGFNSLRRRIYRFLERTLRLPEELTAPNPIAAGVEASS